MHDELDKLIDGALATYSNAEPLGGIEQRVLDRVRLAESRRRRWRRTLVLAAPALAATLLVILAPKPEPVPVAVVVRQPAPIALPILPVAPAPAPRRVAKARRPVRTPEPPKRDLFPTLSPLTGEERLLVQLAQASPQLLLARLVDEIEIKPIQIAPLRIEGAQ